MWEIWVRFLGGKDPLEKVMATRSSTLAWKIPWVEEPGELQSMGSQRVGHAWATSLLLYLSYSSLLQESYYCSRYCICIQTMGWKKDLVVLGTLSLPLYQESKIIPRHTQKKTTSLSLVRVVSLGLFSKNLHSILTTFSFSFLIFKEGSGCHFCVSVVHNRKNTYGKRSDTEGTLRT